MVFFHNPQEAFFYISRKEVIPFLILSHINMPVMNGFQLTDKIHEDPELRIKYIPYIFLTTGGENKLVWEAYAKNAQDFFIKPTSMAGWRGLLSMMLGYWETSRKPRP